MISFQKKTQLCCSSEICSDWKIRNNWNQAEHWRKQPQMDSHIGRNAQGKCNLRWTWNSSKPCTLNPLKGPFVFMIPRQQGSSRIVPARPSKSKKIFQDSCIPMSNLILKQVCFLQFFYLATYLVISAFLGVPFLPVFVDSIAVPVFAVWLNLTNTVFVKFNQTANTGTAMLSTRRGLMGSERVWQMTGVGKYHINWEQLNKYHNIQILLFLPVGCLRGVCMVFECPRQMSWVCRYHIYWKMFDYCHTIYVRPFLPVPVFAENGKKSGQLKMPIWKGKSAQIKNWRKQTCFKIIQLSWNFFWTILILDEPRLTLRKQTGERTPKKVIFQLWRPVKWKKYIAGPKLGTYSESAVHEISKNHLEK